MAWNIYRISLFLLLVFLAQQVSSQELSCKGRCSESFERGRPCDCDADCDRYSKCCADYEEACLVVPTTPAPTTTTTTTVPTTTTTTTTTPLPTTTTTKPSTTTPKPKSTTKRSPKLKPKPKPKPKPKQKPKPKPKPKPNPPKKKKKQKKVSHEIMEEHSEQSSSSSTSSKIRRTMASSTNSDDKGKKKKKKGKTDKELEEEEEEVNESSKSSLKSLKSKAVKVISEEDGSGIDNAVTTVATTSTTTQPSTTTTLPSTTTTTKLPTTTTTTKLPTTTTTTIQPTTTTKQSATMTKQPTMTTTTLPTTTEQPTTATKQSTTKATTKLPTTTTELPSTTTKQPDTEKTTPGNKDREPTKETPTNKNTNTTVTQVTTTSLKTSKPSDTSPSTVDKTTPYTSTLPTILIPTKRKTVTYLPTTTYTTISTAKLPEWITNLTAEYVRPEKFVTPLLYKDVPQEMNLCNRKPADGIVPLQNGSLAVFRGHYYWLLNGTSPPSPCPRKITEVWGIPSPIDTVFSRCNCDGKTFFFKDSQYWRFTDDKMDSGYPKAIVKGFGGLNGKITGALSVAKHKNRPETVYFFKKGGNLQQYTYKQGGTKKCKKKVVTVKYPAYKPKAVIRKRRRRFERSVRPAQILRTVRVQHRPVVQIRHQPTGVLQPEVKVSSYWRGFPKEVNSVISVPNDQKADGYDYYAFSKDQYYSVDVGSRIARPVTLQTGQTVSGAWYKCPSE